LLLLLRRPTTTSTTMTITTKINARDAIADRRFHVALQKGCSSPSTAGGFRGGT
jgi:hypothetical protein